MKNLKNIYSDENTIFYDEFNGVFIIRDRKFVVKKLSEDKKLEAKNITWIEVN